MNTCRRPASAFTLIELLVVISIIALLLALMLPSLQSARAVARMTKCSVQLRQVNTSLSLYQTDFKQYYPPTGWKEPSANQYNHFWNCLIEHQGYLAGRSAENIYGKTTASCKDPAPALTCPSEDQPQENVINGWHATHYGKNEFAGYHSSAVGHPGGPSATDTVYTYTTRSFQLKLPEPRVYLLGCATGWSAAQNKKQGLGGTISYLNGTLLGIQRHQKRFPMSFVDGHGFVENEPAWFHGSSEANAKRAAKEEWHAFTFTHYNYATSPNRW